MHENEANVAASRGTAEESSPALSGVRLFPIGFGLGAVAALALFFGYRAVLPEADGESPGDVAGVSAAPLDASAMLETTSNPSVEEASAEGVVEAGPLVGATDGSEPAMRIVVPDAPPDTSTYAAAGADMAAATADASALAGLDELASLSALPGVPTDRSVDDGLPKIDDPATSDLFGGSVVMVSSTVPRVIVLADGTSLVPGESLPGGHRIVDIRRERILLERDGVEWRIGVP